nr:Chain Z, THR-VAL-PHE-THR-SER-TRP-GLU-GLU-TYR-LEU-ASP-TRP-VAL-MET-PRO-TRP-ASN-LEU-VAL-ARG-ILE-GLY-LEU-LEU [synthetic construct]
TVFTSWEEYLDWVGSGDLMPWNLVRIGLLR